MKRAVYSLILASFLLVTPERGVAAMAVIDVKNIAQSLLIALRTLQSNYNEAKMLANQVLSLQNELKNLQNLRFDVIDEFSSNFTGLYGAIGRVDGIIQHINNLDQKFREFYPEFATQEVSEIQQSLVRMTQISRDMIEGALQTGAHVIDALPQTQAQIENLTLASQGSVGILQATQAGNQIAGNIATQLANLNAQMATATQATSAFYMQAVQTRAADEKRHESALRDWGEPIRAVPVPQSPIW